MKIHHLKNNEIDKKKWDRTILSSPNGNLYGFSWYLDIVSPDWEALVSDNYEVLFPLTIKKYLTFKTLRQPLFAQQLGIFVQNLSYFEFLPEIFKYIFNKYSYININFNKLVPFDNFSFNKNVRLIQKINYELDLISSYKTLYKHFNENTKRNIKKSKREDIYVKIDGIRQETFLNFLRSSLEETTEINKLSNTKLKKIASIISYTQKQKISKIYSVHRLNGSLLSVAAFIYSHNKAYYLFAASNLLGKEYSSMFMLIDEFIKNHAERNLTLDFEGSMIPNLARFYKGFGSKETFYVNLKYKKSII
jgi:hypothetical protein